MNQRLKKEYENYMDWFNSTVRHHFPKAKPQTPEQFVWNKYRDNVYWYLMEEWTGRDISDVLYGNVEWSEEDTEEQGEDYAPGEEKATELQNSCEQMVWDCFQKNEGVSNTAGLVYEFLKNEGLVE